MSIQNFPHEILIKIFRLLVEENTSRRSLLDCALVCQSWYRSACCIMYEKLNVKRLNKLIDILSDEKSELGVYCKVLRFTRQWKKGKRTIKCYKDLMSRLPNLQTIILKRSRHLLYHLNHIAQVAELGHCLREISIVHTLQTRVESQAYYRCLAAFKNNIHVIKLAFGETNNSIDGEVGRIISHLPEFTFLTTLEIRCLDSPKNQTLRQTSMFSIMGSLPNLKSFTFQSVKQEPEANASEDSYTHSRLKYLDIALPDLSVSHIDYLINNIDQLERLKLRIEPQKKTTQAVSWIKKCGADRLHHFQIYLRGIKEVKLILIDSLQTDLEKYVLFAAGNISGQHSAPTCVYLQIGDYGFKEQLILEKSAIYSYLHFELLATNLPSLTEQVTLPLASALEETSVQSFHACLDQPRNHVDEPYIHYLNTFQKALNCFPNVLDYSLLKGVEFKNGLVNVASDRVKKARYDLAEKRMIMYPTRYSITPSDKLAFVTLGFMESTKDITATLALLPHNAKFLKIYICSELKEIIRPQNSIFGIDKYVIDLHDLHLKQLDVDMGILFLRFGTYPIMLKVEYQGSNQTSYFKWDQLHSTGFKPFNGPDATDDGLYGSSTTSVFIIKCRALELFKFIYKSGPYGKDIVGTALDLRAQ